jgi:hypothetical protein
MTSTGSGAVDAGIAGLEPAIWGLNSITVMRAERFAGSIPAASTFSVSSSSVSFASSVTSRIFQRHALTDPAAHGDADQMRAGDPKHVHGLAGP